MVTIRDVRALAEGLPRAYEVVVRDRVKFRVGRIVWLAFSRDETLMGFAFPKDERSALIESAPEKFRLPKPSDLRYNWVVGSLAAIDLPELREIVFDAWSMVVPKRLSEAQALATVAGAPMQVSEPIAPTRGTSMVTPVSKTPGKGTASKTRAKETPVSKTSVKGTATKGKGTAAKGNGGAAKVRCETRPHATLDFPFGEQTAVYKIGGKMFALMSVDELPGRLTLKVDPDEGEALVEQYGCINPGFYMNKRHWITVTLDHELPVDVLEEIIDDSYQLVRNSLPKKTQALLAD
jgi:predicted DNA-binding protein (MmcQ/YjbR family)